MTTREERRAKVWRIISEILGDRMRDMTHITTAIDDYYHPRIPRPVQTSLGVVTYHDEGDGLPWRLMYKDGEWLHFKRLAEIRYFSHLTDDDIERCIALPKAPWVEAVEIEPTPLGFVNLYKGLVGCGFYTSEEYAREQAASDALEVAVPVYRLTGETK